MVLGAVKTRLSIGFGLHQYHLACLDQGRHARRGPDPCKLRLPRSAIRWFNVNVPLYRCFGRPERVRQMMETSQQELNGEVGDANQQQPNETTTDANQQQPNETATDANPQQPETEQQDYGYEFYHGEELRNEEELYSFRIRPDTAPINPATLVTNTPLQTPVASAPLKNSEAVNILIYSVIAAVIAILVAVGVRRMQTLPHPYDDLGAGVFSGAGLKAHLITRWDGTAKYRLKIEPIGLQQQEGFAAVAGNPPRPLFVNIRLMDSSGSALCDKEILLKFDPANANKQLASKKTAAQKADADLLAAQELERERGKDVFQNEIGENGKVVAISAQGYLPCPEQSYKHLDYWDFSTDFPLLAEQDELLKGQKGPAARAERPAAAESNSAGIRPLPAPIEGDDVIIGFAPSKGIAETRAGKVFLINSGGLQDYATGWQIFPAAIHYRCDKKAVCIITRTGTSAVLRARLKR